MFVVLFLLVEYCINGGNTAGLSPKTETAVLGIPVGLELMGRRWEDDQLLDLAERAEKILQSRRRPPI